MKGILKGLIFLAVFWLGLIVPQGNACDACKKSKAFIESEPATLIEGLGDWKHKVSTSDEEAQCFFNQGLNFAYAFNHYEAIRSFERALWLDSTLAMAHWGIAYALGGNYNMPIDSSRMAEAFRHIQKAIALLPHASPEEKDYIEALTTRYSIEPGVDWKQLDMNYSDAMRGLAAKYPDDADAATLFAESMMNLRPWKLWSHDGQPAPGTMEILASLEGVLRRIPNHPGAMHFYIHAVEASKNPEWALAASNRLLTALPAAGHLVHMPAHIYLRTGDYLASMESNKAAIAADERYFESVPRGLFYELAYYSHNVHFLTVSAGMAGMTQISIANARKLDAHLMPYIPANPMVEGISGTTPLMLTRFQQWDEILSEKLPDTNFRLINLFWRYARVCALVATGKTKDAEKEFLKFQKAKGSIREDQTVGFMNSAKVVAEIATLVQLARIAEAKGDVSGALTSLQTAVQMQDSLNYDEPEGWYLPVRESLGGLLLRSGKAAEAASVFREDLEHHARNGRALFGLREALLAMGDQDAAAMVDREFQSAWKDADIKLSVATL